MSEPATLSRKVFYYLLIAFNVLFLSYVVAVSYFNRLALDDFGCLWVVNKYGFFNPFTYWYHNWQGRFGPEFLLTLVLIFYRSTSILLLYPVLLSLFFIYSFYLLLKLYFPLPKAVLVNYSILLFSALLLTTFELNTFYWICTSVDYFGGIAFALFGVVLLVQKKEGWWQYIMVALCFMYAASSSEHVGALVCSLLFLTLLYILFTTAYYSEGLSSHLKNFTSPAVNKKLITAFLVGSVVFIMMVLAPGTKVRMSATEHVTDPVDLLRKTFDATIFVCRHIFYKLPYIILYAPLFLLFGSYLEKSKLAFRINSIYILMGAFIILLSLIFVSNIPMAYAIGTVAPLRSYVYVSFLLVIILFLICVYAGFQYQSRLKGFAAISIVFLAALSALVFYTFYTELPLLRKYAESHTQRMEILSEHKALNRTEPVYLPPLYNPDYVTVTERWRALTNSDKIPSPMSDMPVVVGEISETTDWKNDMLKRGLGLTFDVYKAPEGKQTESK